MESVVARCPYCGSTELEVFEPEQFAGGEADNGKPSLWCPQCLYHHFPGAEAEHPKFAVSPPLSFAGYAEPEPEPEPEPEVGRLKAWWEAIRAHLRAA